MGDTTWARHRHSRLRRHPCKGGREVRPSCRNRSRSSVHLELFVQYSYPHPSPLLQWRRPPCASESSCLRARLPPWRDVAAERHDPGVSNADPHCSNFPLLKKLIHFHLTRLKDFFHHSIYMVQRGLTRPGVFLLRDEPLPSGTASLSFRSMLGKPQY